MFGQISHILDKISLWLVLSEVFHPYYNVFISYWNPEGKWTALMHKYTRSNSLFYLHFIALTYQLPDQQFYSDIFIFTYYQSRFQMFFIQLILIVIMCVGNNDNPIPQKTWFNYISSVQSSNTSIG